MRLRQVQIVGAKIVAPHRHAVRLVHHQPLDAGIAEGAHKGQLAQAFGRHIDQPVFAGGDPLNHLAQVVTIQAAVHCNRLAAQVARQPVDLILHERYQRRHNQRDAPAVLVKKGRQLVAERLAGSGGHDGQDMLPAPGAGQHFGLAGQKLLVAKQLFGLVRQLPPFLGRNRHRGERSRGRGRRPVRGRVWPLAGRVSG